MPVSFVVRLMAWLWLGAAAASGYFLWLRALPPLGLPLVSALLALLASLASRFVPPLRRWLDSIDLRVLVLLHVTRFVGVYFLLLFQRGELPRSFAVSAGAVDIIVATMALPVALAPLEDGARRRAIVIWNVVGFVGLLLMLTTIARLSLANPLQLRALTVLPLCLVPTFLVPVLLATHVMIFARTRALSGPDL